jgi:hypothetical protein
MLIDPELIDATRLMPLTKLVDAVEQLTFEQQEAIGDKLCADQEAKYPAIASRIRRLLEQARRDGDYHIQLIRAAFIIGVLKTYALRDGTTSTYTLRAAWWYAVGSLHNPERSIKECIFVIDTKRFEEQTPEWQVANRSLFVGEEEAKQFLRPRPPSEAQLQHVSHEIVEEFARDNRGEGQKLKKSIFIEKVMKKLGCNKAWAQRAWKNCAPASWKKPGRPRSRRSSGI